MGKTNLILLAMGVVSMVALSLMMQYVVGVQQERAEDPLVQQLMQTHGSQLEEPPRLVRRLEGRGPVAVLEIRPILGVPLRPLAMQMGAAVWQSDRESLAAVRVVCLGFGDEPLERFDVPKPAAPPAAK